MHQFSVVLLFLFRILFLFVFAINGREEGGGRRRGIYR